MIVFLPLDLACDCGGTETTWLLRLDEERWFSWEFCIWHPATMPRRKPRQPVDRLAWGGPKASG